MQIASLYGAIGLNVTPKTWKNLDLIEAKFERLLNKFQLIQKEQDKALDFSKVKVKGINSAISSADQLVRKLERIKQLKTTSVRVSTTFNEKSAHSGSQGSSGKESVRSRMAYAGGGSGGGFIDTAFKTSLIGAAIYSILEIPMMIDGIVDRTLASTGSEEKTKEYIQFLKKTSTEFGLKVNDVANPFVKFMAGTKDSNIKEEDAFKIFRGFAGAGLAFGMTGEEQKRMFNALTQMVAKGQVMAEEVKTQLGDVLPGAIAAFAKANNMNTKEFLKAMEKGLVKPEVLIAASKSYESTAEGMLERRRQTMEFKFVSVSNAWVEFWANFFNGPAYKRVTDILDKVVEILLNPKTANAFGELIANGLQKVVDLLGLASDKLGTLENTTTFEEKLKIIKETLVLLVAGLTLLSSGNPLAGLLSGMDKVEGRLGKGKLGFLLNVAMGVAKPVGYGLFADWMLSKGESDSPKSSATKIDPLSTLGVAKQMFPSIDTFLLFSKYFASTSTPSYRFPEHQDNMTRRLKYGDNPYTQAASNTIYVDNVILPETTSSVSDFANTVLGLTIPSFTGAN